MTSIAENEQESYYKQGIEFFTKEIKQWGLDGYCRVLEAGSGNGRWLMAFSTLGSQVIGVEPREEGIAQAQSHRKRLGLADVNVVRATAEHIPICSESADLYFSYGVLMYCKKTNALKEADRVLVDGGAYFIAVQGPGYPLIRMLHGLKARDFAQFEMAARRLLSDVRNRLVPRYFDEAEGSIPKKSLIKAINDQKWGIAKIDDLGWRGTMKCLSFPIFYYITGKKCLPS